MPNKMDATMLHEKEGEIHNFYAPLIHSLICFKGTLKHLGAFESCKEVISDFFIGTLEHYWNSCRDVSEHLLARNMIQQRVICIQQR